MKIGSSQKAYINYLKMKKNYKLKKSSAGYYYVYPSPNKEYLDKYYKNKYFKKNLSYKDNLKFIEKKNLKINALVKIFMIKIIVKKLNKYKILDLGAGTGNFLSNIKKYFKSHLGVDFSKKNIKKSSYKKINFLEESPESFVERKLNVFNLITLNNVLEHVPDPNNFMKNLHKNTSKNTLFLITIPNDFSKLQTVTGKKVKKKYWLAPPEHLNYFNKNNFKNFAKKRGFKILDAISDFPIELFLLKKEFNYTNNKNVGKNIHLLRCEIISYIAKENKIEDLYKFYKFFYELNIGRDMTYLLKKVN